MSSPATSPLCESCAAMLEQHDGVTENDPEDPEWRREGTTKDVYSLEASARSGCTLCLTILKSFPEQELAWARKHLDLASQDLKMEYQATYQFTESSRENQEYRLNLFYGYIPPTCEPGEYDIYHLLVSLMPHEGMFQILLTDIQVLLISIALKQERFSSYNLSDRLGAEGSFGAVQEWLAECNLSHDCQPLLPKSKPFLPTRLLDVGTADNFEDISLYESEYPSLSEKYITLSHCWGLNPIATLQKCSISAFTKNIQWKSLPLTFQDAIVVTRKLKIRFLWIDSLCIIQDDEDDWLRESMLMADVYSHSYLNLAAAASSDSHGGLFRQRASETAARCLVNLRWSSPRGPPAGLFYCCQLDEWEIGVGNAPLYSRAWVCQERLLSPRVLNFAEDQLFWECNDLHASEAWPAGLPPGTTRVFQKDVLRETAQKRDLESSLWAWNSVVRNYSEGRLTRSSDKLIAISAIARFFVEQGILKQQDYLAGLWRPNLPQALMWKGPVMAGRPGGSTERFGRRPQPYRAPSWSWASIDWTVTPATFGHAKFETLAELLDASTVPAANPLGAVTSGRLRIRGFPFRAYLVPEETSSFSTEDCCRLFLEENLVDGSTGRLDEVDTQSRSRFEVYCLPLKLQMISDNFSEVWVQGLLLHCAGDALGQFKRIGVFDIFGLDGFDQFLTALQEHPHGEPVCEDRTATTERLREVWSWWQELFPGDRSLEPKHEYTISLV